MSDLVERLRDERFTHPPRGMLMEAADEIERLRKQLAGARHNAIEECAKVAEAQAQEFLSPKYAANQPYGSICERFACVEAAKAIRALLTDEQQKED